MNDASKNPLPLTEKDLIQGCLRKDRDCERELFRRFAPVLFTVSRQYARFQHEAEDILQDAFIRIFDKLGSFRHDGSLEGWMRKITVQTALKRYQRIRYQKEQAGTELLPEAANLPEILSQLHEEELLRLIGTLPDGYRVVFNLSVIEGYSHQEIAQTLGIGESTSRSQLAKARGLLQQKIQELEKIRA